MWFVLQLLAIALLVKQTLPKRAGSVSGVSDRGFGFRCYCGITKQPRIVGGNVTTVNEFPWLVGIAYSSDEIIFCGGALIASKWVVTASHCLYADIPVSASDLRVILGEYDLSTVNEEYLPRRVLRISLILLHYYYDSVTMHNDIALLKVAEVVDMNIYAPVCLPPPDLDTSGKTAWVYGWGHTSYAGIPSNQVHKVEVPIVTRDVCQAAYNDIRWKISPGILCAGGEEGRDACQGDSGGPLTMMVDGKHTLVGDVSSGYKCAQAGRYGLYAETAFYREWIDQNMEKYGGAKFC